MWSFRPVVDTDVPALLAIYAPYVSDTTVTFETETPSLAKFSARVDALSRSHAFLVAELNGEIVSYAYGGPHRVRAAYAPTVEVSIYTADAHKGSGVSRQLYQLLIAVLARLGYRQLIGVITHPNPASERFHKTLGFEFVAKFSDVAYKNGEWLDTIWYALRLSHAEGPFDPKTFDQIAASGEWSSLLAAHSAQLG